MPSKISDNIYLEKIAEKNTKEHTSTTGRAVTALGAGGAALFGGNTVADVLGAPGRVTVHNMLRSVEGVPDASDETVNKFVEKYKIKHFEVQHPKFDPFNPLAGVEQPARGPHAMPRSIVTNAVHKHLDLSKLRPETASQIPNHVKENIAKAKKVTEGGYDGFIDMAGNKSNATKLHELGHLVNQKRYNLTNMRVAGSVGGVAAKGMLFSKDHAEDAWKVHALSHVPMLADELGTNARAYNFIRKHEPSALKKSRAGILASALSYTNHVAASTAGMYAAGKLSKGIQEKATSNHEKVAFNISAMMPAKPKVAIGVEAALSRSGALARARNVVPTANFGAKAISKFAEDFGENPFGGGKVKDNIPKGRVLPDEIHNAADLAVKTIKGVGEVGRQGLHHLLGSKVNDHVAKHTGMSAEWASTLSPDGMKGMLKDNPEALSKLNTLLRVKHGTRALVGGGAAYLALKKLSAPPKDQTQYYNYGNY